MTTGEGEEEANDECWGSFVGQPDTNPFIVMAGLVPAIHGFLVG